MKKTSPKLTVTRAGGRLPPIRQYDAVDWYFVCAICEAKWFAPTNTADCPRCGATSKSNERIMPPWIQHGRNPK